MKQPWLSRMLFPFVAVAGCAGDGAGTPGSNPGDGGPGSPPGGTGSLDFETQVQPIFTQNCACHQSFSAPQGEILLPGSTYDATVNVPSTENPSILRIKPGDPDNSYLVIKIDDGVPEVSTRRVGERMPRGLPPLKATEIQTIRQWVKEGALRAAVPGNEKDTEPPTFNGATIATPAGTNAIDVFWDFASDDKTAKEEIIYKIYLSTQSRGENFHAPSASPSPGASSARVEG